MANRWLDQYIYGFVKQPVHVLGRIKVGSLQSQTVSTVADSGGSLNSKYFLLSSMNRITGAEKKWYVWFNINSAGVDPAVTGRTGIQVAGATGVTANALATAIRAALNALPNDFVATGATNAVIITDVVNGPVTAAVDGAAATGFTFGAATAGVADTAIGGGISSIRKLSTGVFKVQLQDKYNYFFAGFGQIAETVTGSAVAGGSFVVGTLYQIATLGNTTLAQWQAAGLPSGVTPAVGVAFVATGVGAGTGTVKAVGNSGITSVEVASDYNGVVNQPTAGLYVTTWGPTSSSVTTPVLTDPPAGAILNLFVILRNSSVKTGRQ